MNTTNSQQFDLQGLRTLVTGGGSGIGRAIAEGLTKAGATVVVCDLDPNTKPDYLCDVSRTEQVDEMFDAVNAKFGGLDILVNNVGVPGPTARVQDTNPDAFDQTVQVGLGGTFRCTRRAVPMMTRGGSIINISSTAGIFGFPLRSPYAAAKWGIVGLTHTWAMELGETGIRVNAICPGSVSGSRMDGVIEREAQTLGISPEQIRSGYTNQVAMKSFIDKSDIAALAVFLSSPSARFVNGQIISVDGYTETMRTVGVQ